MLISDILDLAKIESNTMNFIFSRTSLNSVFDSVFQEQKFNNHPNTQDVNLELDLPPEIIYIVTDYQRLKQVLNNLVNNAFKFTTEGSIRIGFDLTDNGVLLFVEDTGKGISQEHVERIFDRFYKIDSFIAGTGLGLSICKTIIERLQGDISVQSEVGKGSRFTIHLPLDMDIPESE